MVGKTPATAPSNIWDLLKWFMCCCFLVLIVIIIIANATPRCPVCPGSTPVVGPAPGPGPDSLL